MTNKTMGDMICTLRKEQGMTQKELADKLNVTDKAVSKWERNVSFPDTGTIPKLAELFGITIDELMTAPPVPHRSLPHITDLILTAVPLAMGVAVTVISLLGEPDNRHAITMLGIGMCCLALRELCKREQHRH